MRRRQWFYVAICLLLASKIVYADKNNFYVESWRIKSLPSDQHSAPYSARYLSEDSYLEITMHGRRYEKPALLSESSDNDLERFLFYALRDLARNDSKADRWWEDDMIGNVEFLGRDELPSEVLMRERLDLDLKQAKNGLPPGPVGVSHLAAEADRIEVVSWITYGDYRIVYVIYRYLSRHSEMAVHVLHYDPGTGHYRFSVTLNDDPVFDTIFRPYFFSLKQRYKIW